MQRLLDVLLPPTCPGCGREGEIICARCRKTLTRRLREPAGVPLGLPSKVPAGIVQLEWCAAYNGPARACLHALKYDGERRLVGPLAEIMAERWARAGIGGDVIAYVPVHAARKRQRGFDQAELLARGVANRLGLSVVPAVRRATKTTAQHALGRRARPPTWVTLSRRDPTLRGCDQRLMDSADRRPDYDGSNAGGLCRGAL